MLQMLGQQLIIQANLSGTEVGIFRQIYIHGPLTKYAKLWVAHAPGMSGPVSPPPRVSDPDMHHGTCVTHVPWYMPVSLTIGFLWGRWRGKRSRHSRCMRISQVCISGKRPMPSSYSAALCQEALISNGIGYRCILKLNEEWSQLPTFSQYREITYIANLSLSLHKMIHFINGWHVKMGQNGNWARIKPVPPANFGPIIACS